MYQKRKGRRLTRASRAVAWVRSAREGERELKRTKKDVSWKKEDNNMCVKRRQSYGYIRKLRWEKRERINHHLPQIDRCASGWIRQQPPNSFQVGMSRSTLDTLPKKICREILNYYFLNIDNWWEERFCTRKKCLYSLELHRM